MRKAATRRTIFFISDRTAITAITLGQSLLTQFDHVDFEEHMLPFVETAEKAQAAVDDINAAATAQRVRPIVFSTLIDPEILRIIKSANCLLLDFFETFITGLETELSATSSHVIGRYHGMANRKETYEARIEAVNYAINNDDGSSTKNYHEADVILIGVSRTGKTPTCLYLGLQFGLFAANYPFIEESVDAAKRKLPDSLRSHRDKLYGLTLIPERLHIIRSQRRPNSEYASLGNCRREVTMAESIFKAERLPYLDVGAMSVEEIATTIIHKRQLKRRYF